MSQFSEFAVLMENNLTLRKGVDITFSYFVIETATHSMMCLICNQVVKTVKGDNAKQHFRRHESHSYAKLKGDSRKICIENLKMSVRKQTTCLTTFAKSTNSRCEASYREAYHLGVAGKSYSDGELLKRCFVDVVKCIHPGKDADYSSIALAACYNAMQAR